jgi:glycosyltransferase involved in cell wall biosynthesis
MESQDGVQLLIESIEYLVKQRGRTDIQFTLVGSGNEAPRLQALAPEFRVQDFIQFTGLLPRTSRFLSFSG